MAATAVRRSHPEQRENELVVAKEQVRPPATSGRPCCGCSRPGAGSPCATGAGSYADERRYWATGFPDITALEQWRWSVECLRGLADFAGEHGVTLALQNHQPVVQDHHDMLDMVREVNSPALQACLDCPLLAEQDDRSVAEAVRATGARQVHSHYGGEFEEVNGEAVQRPIRFAKRGLVNYPAFIKALAEIGYTGYLCYEFCHPCLGERHEMLGLEEVKRQVSLAQRYLRRAAALRKAPGEGRGARRGAPLPGTTV